MTANSSELVRLQKALADAGVGSRRECEQLIADGRVDIDGQVVTQLGTKVHPYEQAIRVDGVPLKRKRRRYFAVHKPPGVVSTSKDQWRRVRVIDLVASNDRLFNIGRLDKESSGLILVTNDGELANRLTHPRYGVEKTYQVTVAGIPTREVLTKLRRGVTLSDGRVKADTISIKRRYKQSSLLEIVLTEGRNREIRRMLARFDHKVMKLKRVAIGPVRLGNLPLGAHRELTGPEIRSLQNWSSGKKKSPTKKKRPVKRSSGRTGTAKSKGSTGSSTSKKKSPPRKAPKTGAIIGGSSGGRTRSRTPKRS